MRKLPPLPTLPTNTATTGTSPKQPILNREYEPTVGALSFSPLTVNVHRCTQRPLTCGNKGDDRVSSGGHHTPQHSHHQHSAMAPSGLRLCTHSPSSTSGATWVMVLQGWERRVGGPVHGQLQLRAKSLIRRDAAYRNLTPHLRRDLILSVSLRIILTTTILFCFYCGFRHGN